MEKKKYAAMGVVTEPDSFPYVIHSKTALNLGFSSGKSQDTPLPSTWGEPKLPSKHIKNVHASYSWGEKSA